MALVKLLTLLCIVFTSSHPFVNSRTENKIDHRQLERELKVLNKSPIKTIKTKEGDIIDCIDIYKQPTLDHPLLKNHTIQLNPTALPKNDKDKISATRNAGKIPGAVGCPMGTVPIRRTSKEDLIRGKSFFNKITTNIHPLTGLTPGRHQAIMRSIVPSRYTYRGIEATFSLHRPFVGPGQSSSSQMWIESGTPGARNTIQVGWMVNQDLFGDNSTRNFGFWHNNGLSNTPGCFNYLCPGFVQVDPDWTLGMREPYHSYGDNRQSTLTLRVMQDKESGNWWMSVPSYNINVGYWPRKLFTSLTAGATQVIWGGQTFADTSGASPPMSCGHFPPEDYLHGCYMTNMKIIEPLRNYLFDPPQLERFVDNTDCYNVTGYGDNDWPLEHSFLFGGPGGNNCGI
ncbi:hypothetical protein ACHQM5_027372 [Ranunculus cassubicifolius]